ncbi:sensor histidine kinase [Oceanobacter sp. RED65]|uniref:histidine kinase n=2 Tax=Bermanella marisrubri TaxID=207949 RepID=Q1N3B1_9GAMM|nr:sensor histidine kinase [Oceanobacter sp. RED65] [Bermanella marisrubri]
MLGWYFHWPSVLQLGPDWAPMQFNTALCFLLLALASLLNNHHFLARLISFVLMSIGLITLFQYIFKINTGLDQLFMEHWLFTRTSHPGRMAPNTALCFVLLSIYFAVPIKHRLSSLIIGPASGFAFGLSLMALIGYATGMSFAYGWQELTSMAVHTAFLFFIMSSALLRRQYIFWKDKPFEFIRWQTATLIPLVIFIVVGIKIPHIRTQEIFLLETAEADSELIGNRMELRLAREGAEIVFTPDHEKVLIETMKYFSSVKNYHYRLLINGKVLDADHEDYWEPIAVYDLNYEDSVIQVQLYPSDKKSQSFIRYFYFSIFIAILFAALAVWLLLTNYKRQQTLAMLATSNIRMQILFESSQFGLAILDSHLNIEQKNESFLKVIDHADINSLKEVVDNRKDYESLLDIDKKQKITVATRIKGKSVEVSLSQFGGVGERLLVCKELSSSPDKGHQTDSSNLLDITLNASGCCLCLCDEKGEIFISNSDFDDWQDSNVAAAGRVISQYIHSNDLPEFQDKFKQAIQEKNGPKALECRLSKSGTWEWCTCRITAQADLDSNQELITVNFQSIEDKRKLIRQLEQSVEKLKQANSDVEQFAYIASHDLKSPLVGIKNVSEWLIEDYSDALDEEGQDHLRMIKGRCNRMAALLDDLLIYSRTGTHELVYSDINVKALVKDVCQLHDCLNITDIQGEELHISVDKRALEIAIRNVISNALKHNTNEKKKIRVTIEEKADQAYISVEDNGEGVNEQYFDTIFLPFKTLKPRDQMEGSGMGLAITAKAVRRLRGKIDVSKSELGGLNMTISIPKQRGQL